MRPQDQRPLSPHVGIYRWQMSNGLSILHRITGVGLSLGLIILVLWLWGAAYDAALYETLHFALGTWLGKLALLGFTAAFFYHLGNGIRHLNWDRGHGFSIPDMHASGYLVVVFTIAMTVLTWAIAHAKGGW